MSAKNYIAKLKKYFQKTDNVLLAYLFGSQAIGNTGPMSDYDIGIYLKQKISFDQKYYLEVDLRKILNTPALDLVIMNRASLALNYNIICGKCIFCIDQAIRVEYEATISSRFFDFLPVLTFHHRDILNSVRNERRIQWNRSVFSKTEKLLAEMRAV